MGTKVIFIYCLADTISRALNLEEKPGAKMTHSEVISFVVIAALFYQCNYRLTRMVSMNCRWFSSPLSESRMNRRIHQIPEATWLMIFSICRNSNLVGQEYIIDSFPVAVCQNYKRFRCKLFPGKKFHGYTASKKQYFFGIKVHMIINANGVPIEFVFTPAAEADLRGLHRMKLDLPKQSVLFGDKAYTDYALEDFLKEDLQISLISKRKKNSRRKHGCYDELKLSLTRNKIETVFSSLVGMMPRCIRARTERGFCLKVMFFILAYTMKLSLQGI